MNHTLAMGAIERVGDLDAGADELARRQRPATEARGQRLALEEFHDQIVHIPFAADIEERADVRVIETGDRARLLFEPRARVDLPRRRRRQDLQSDAAVETRVAGAIDLTHAAGADPLDDFVRSEPHARTDQSYGLDGGLIEECP